VFKFISNAILLIGALCLIAFGFWGDEIQQFSRPLFVGMQVTFALAFMLAVVKGHIARERDIGACAVAKYKKENNID